MRMQYLSATLLLVVGACSSAASNLIKNPDLAEAYTSSMPIEWFTEAWGENTTVFEYNQKEGYHDSTSLKVTVTSYTSGDAKWWFKHVPVVPSESYRFSDWYKADTESYVIVDFLMENNTHFYLDLQTAERADVWSEYEDYFEVPTGARLMTIFHLLRGVGTLSTDHFSLVKVKRQGFFRPLLTITFDDGLPDNLLTAVPLLKKYHLPSTFYFATEFFEQGPFEDFSQKGEAAIKLLATAGHEIGAHSVSHPDLTQASSDRLVFELEHSKAYLEHLLGKEVRNFATPYGSYNQEVLNALKARYRSHRSVDEGFNLKDRFDPYRLVVQNIRADTTRTQLVGWIEQAKREQAWLILVYHRITDTPKEFDTRTTDFAAQVEEIVRSGIEVVTIEQALDELVPQLTEDTAGTL